MNKSLSSIGSIIQYGISQIPVIGGVAGQHPDNDSLQKILLVSPFTINSMYVVSDEAGYRESSGHQMCGIAISAIYNNQLAMQYVSSLYT